MEGFILGPISNANIIVFITMDVPEGWDITEPEIREQSPFCCEQRLGRIF